MVEDFADKVRSLSTGDEVKIHFSDDSPGEEFGIGLEDPLETTVGLATKRKLDHPEGHDVDGIVSKYEVHLDVPDSDDVHGEYVLEAEAPVVGENRASRTIEARDYFKGVPGNGEYAIHLLGVEDLEVIE